MKQAAVFDMDGLLFDTERLYQQSWTEIAKRLGYEPNPGFPVAICGTSGPVALQTIHRFYPETDAQAFWDAGVAWVNRALEQSVPKKPGVDEILRCFQEAGMRLAVASSSDRDMVESNLRRAGIASCFDTVLCGGEVARGKPAPDIFLEAARRLGCAPQDCYVFEDGVNGVRAGLAAGCATVMIPDLIQPPEELRIQCLAVCSSLLEACDRFRQGRL